MFKNLLAGVFFLFFAGAVMAQSDNLFPDYLPKGTYHVVQKGDSLWAIAKQFSPSKEGKTWPELFARTTIRSGRPELIFPGEFIYFPREWCLEAEKKAASKILSEQRQAAAIIKLPAAQPVPQPVANLPWWPFLLMPLLAAIVFAWLAGAMLVRNWKFWRFFQPDADPVAPRPESDRAAIDAILSQIGRTRAEVEKIESVVLDRPTIALMARGSGGQERVRLPAGDRVFRVFFKDGTVKLFRFACVNGLISDQILEMQADANIPVEPVVAPRSVVAPKPEEQEPVIPMIHIMGVPIMAVEVEIPKPAPEWPIGPPRKPLERPWGPRPTGPTLPTVFKWVQGR